MTDDPYAVLESDPSLGPVVAEVGRLELTPADDLFERLIVSLIRQQVSIDAADAIQERVFEAAEVTPEGMLEAEAEALREAGLSNAKIDYVEHVATAFREHEYDRAYFADLSDEAVMDELTDVRGVGPWTAKMFLMFGLGREDVFPVEDLGIRKGMELLEGEMTRTEMVERAEDWRPYRSYASLYLWHLYEDGDTGVGIPQNV